jgi:hypothetical protein
VEEALQADIRAARSPSPAARSLDHKLGGTPEGRRYTAPSYELRRDDGVSFAVPGFNPVEAYEAAIASLEPELPRRPAPESVSEVLAWADEPLATAEIALVAGLPIETAREELTAVAEQQPAGADCYWVAA